MKFYLTYIINFTNFARNFIVDVNFSINTTINRTGVGDAQQTHRLNFGVA